MEHLSDEQQDFIYRELSYANDRTCAIVGLSVLEPLVVDCLEATLRKIRRADESDVFFSKCFSDLIGIGRSVDSFSNQCTLLYLCGTIHEFGLRELKLLAKIRNQFAHNTFLADGEKGKPAGPSFSSGKVAQWCRQLQVAEHMDDPSYSADCRKRFCLSVAVTSSWLANYLRDSAKSANSQETTNKASLASIESEPHSARSEGGTWLLQSSERLAWLQCGSEMAATMLAMSAAPPKLREALATESSS